MKPHAHILCAWSDGDASRQSSNRGVDVGVDAVRAIEDEVWP
jgi:hypothetical protein